jgi:hypothetical protein
VHLKQLVGWESHLVGPSVSLSAFSVPAMTKVMTMAMTMMNHYVDVD